MMKQNMTTRLTVCWVIFLGFFLQTTAYAQIACNNQNPNFPGQISPGNNCIATVDSATVIQGTPCAGPFYFIALTYPFGDTLAQGADFINIPVEDQLGEVISIQSFCMANMCTSYFLVQDKLPPSITCPNDTIVCTASLHPDSLAPVTVTDNCDPDPAVSVVTVPMGPNCVDFATPFVGTVVRQWTAVDASGNDSTCTQMIFILEADTMDVVFPPDITIDCTSPSADTAITGRPTIAGNPVGSLCNIHVSFSDTESAICGGNTLVLRTWTLFNECTMQVATDVQQIVFADTTAPILTCQDTLFFETDTNVCHTDILLPLPMASDDCSPFDITADTPGAGFGFNLTDVPKGTFTVEYTATDSCGNSSTCQSVLVVEDNETPAAVCDGTKLVVLASNGIATLSAGAFDAGSHDNCGPVNFLVSRDGVNFGPSVTFTCADLDAPVMVILRVREVINPNSFTDCMNIVTVQDKFKPVFTICPPNQVIDCEEDYSDLDVFGVPAVFDNCFFTLTGTSTVTIDNCGQGTIVRNWTAADSSGNLAFCTQVISVVNQTPYDGSTIDWPDDYTSINTCIETDDLQPDDLPAGSDFPVVTGAACAMIATSYSDQVFTISYPACYKIVRTWKVLDWCQYDPINPTVGIWTHQQIIAVMDSQAPVITFCPGDTTVGINADCTFGTVSLAPVTATDCSPDITVTNNSPYATSGGANASGNYPAGVHTVTFTVKDGCGNKTTCSVVITVSDLKDPTPYCNTGIVGELQLMAGQVMATVQATQFNNASFDNCTDTVDLEFTIRLVGDTLPPTATSLTFDCSGEGEHLVEIWVTDEAGNSDYCITNVIIQDNMNVCPDDTLVVGNPMIAGEIGTEMGENMPGVNVEISNMSMSENTDGNGSYVFQDLSQGGNYTVVPEKDDDPHNGVSTYDLVLMGRHILGISQLTSPYKLIAADINNSGSVTTADMVELRKLILFITDHFPNNTSWRFVDKDYLFPNPANPFTPPFPEVVNVANLSQQLLDADFVGVKIGDLNCSANANLGDDGNGDRNEGGEMTLLLEDIELKEGEEITVPFRAKDNYDLLALQFTFEFETDDLELQGIEKGVLPGEVEEIFGMSFASEGILTAGWFNLEPVALEPEAALFSLRFRAKKPGNLRNLLAVNSRYTQAAAYNAEERPLNLNLAFTNPTNMTTTAQFQLYQNQPNPFKKMTSIGFSLPETGQAKLTIYDLSGRVLKSYDSIFTQGYNEVSIERSELPTGGVLYYQLETPTQTATRKMILLQ